MSDFTPIKVHFDESEYNFKLSDIEGRCEYFQNILDDLKQINPSITFESEDLIPLFNDTKVFLVSKFVAEPTTINGIELSKDKVFELLECSEELESIIAKINQLNTNNSHLGNQKHLYSVAKFYFINSLGIIELKQDFKDDLKNQHSVFVKNQKQKDAYDSLEIIFQELKKLGNSYNRNEIKFIEENFVWNHNGLIGINTKSLRNLE